MFVLEPAEGGHGERNRKPSVTLQALKNERSLRLNIHFGFGYLTMSGWAGFNVGSIFADNCFLIPLSGRYYLWLLDVSLESP